MKRVAVIGPTGAGKSRLAAQLGEKLDVRVLHLDTLFWKPGWVRTPHEEYVATQRRELAEESWIVEAQYDDMLPDWIDAADTIVFRDVSPLQCFWRVSRRRLDAQPPCRMCMSRLWDENHDLRITTREPIRALLFF